MSVGLAEIEYHGSAGSTGDCLAALGRLLHNQVELTAATLMTCVSGGHREHGLLLSGEHVGTIAIKSGFSSGYSGEGPAGLSAAIVLMEWQELAIEEVIVDASVLSRLDASALLAADVDRFAGGPFVRPRRVWDYVAAARRGDDAGNNPWRSTPPVMPLALVDDRLQDLARRFREDPATALLVAHVRLETTVRERLEPIHPGARHLVGAKLFATAFNGDDALLTWPGLTSSERQGRASLFIGMVLAYRNVRAHHEASTDTAHGQLSEFLLVNHLFQLEGVSIAAAPASPADATIPEAPPRIRGPA